MQDFESGARGSRRNSPGVREKPQQQATGSSKRAASGSPAYSSYLDFGSPSSPEQRTNSPQTQAHSRQPVTLPSSSASKTTRTINDSPNFSKQRASMIAEPQAPSVTATAFTSKMAFDPDLEPVPIYGKDTDFSKQKAFMTAEPQIPGISAAAPASQGIFNMGMEPVSDRHPRTESSDLQSMTPDERRRHENKIKLDSKHRKHPRKRPSLEKK